MDPLGFGFVNLRRHRRLATQDRQNRYRPSGVLRNGKSFISPKELKAILKGKEEEFVAVYRKAFNNCLGRGAWSL